MDKGRNLMNNLLSLKAKAKLEDFFNDLKYKQLGIKVPDYDISQLPEEIEIVAAYDKKNKSYYAECPHWNDIYTASSTIEGLVENINDLVYEFFEVPRFVARNLPQQYKPSGETLEILKKSGAKNIKVKLSPQLAAA